QLRKSAKGISMYRHNPERFAPILKPTHTALTVALGKEPLGVNITADAFSVDDQALWTSEGGENVPLRFYREGVRQLVLKPGITEDELTKLVLIMLTPTERT